MGIRREQPGAAKAAAAAGTAIGTGEKAIRQQAEAATIKRQQMQIKAREQAEQRAMQWETDKMQLRSQQEFEQELRTRQYDLDRFNRAKEWDIEKMELRSRMDFEQEEQERVREIGRVDAKILAVKKAQEDGQFSGREFEYESMLFNLEQQRFGIKNPSRPLDPQKRMLDQAMRQREADASGGFAGDVGGVGPPPPTGELTVQNMEAIAAVGKTYLRRKDTGELVEIPIDRAKDAVDTGRFVFPSVSGASVSSRADLPSMGFYPIEKAAAGTGPGTLVGRVGVEVDKFLGRHSVVAVVSPEGKKEEIHIKDLAEYKKRGYVQDPARRRNTFNF